MIRPIPRKTVYAATLITLLALAGGWTLAAGTTTTQGPAQTTNITVTAPQAFAAATVESTQLMTVSPALISGLNGAAGTQTGAGNGLNGAWTNAVLTTCTVNCGENFSAVETSNTSGLATGLTVPDTSLQVVLTVAQPSATATGFDVQVEAMYTVGGVTYYAFGRGYFNTGNSGGVGTTYIWVGLYVDLGVQPSATGPDLTNVVVSMNGCTVATSCP